LDAGNRDINNAIENQNRDFLKILAKSYKLEYKRFIVVF